MEPRNARTRRPARALGLLGFMLFASAAASPRLAGSLGDVVSLAASAVVSDSIRRDPGLGLTFLDSLLGKSGKLRVRIVAPSRHVPALARIFGDSSPSRPGVYTLDDSVRGRRFAFITLRPFSDKVDGRIGRYRIGYWPFERRVATSEAYANPHGFIEVTPETQDTHVSEHFRLRDFLTHDQKGVWPKYLVLDTKLIDKLELTVQELERQGIDVKNVRVMSGFRTPQYNKLGVGAGGRAQTSRHQYGDAADVFIDNDGDGRMDDLNGDGRIDTRDVRVLIQAVDRVEREHPELIGGAGAYRGTRSHGPFAHIDARGHRARWGAI